jgi:hypothetical protein
VAVIVFVGAAGAGLLAAHADPPLPIPAAKAIAIGARDPALTATARTATDVKVLYIDDKTVTVTWFRDGQGIATVAVHTDGTVFHPATYPEKRAAYGTPLAHDLVLLAALTALFLLATLRGPLRRWRTLDIVALAAFIVPTVLLDRAWLVAGEASAAVLLLYVLVRGAMTAVRGTGDQDGHHDTPVLLQALAARWRAPALPAQIGAALLLATAVMTATSTGIVDVATANLEGATLLTHGVLPYGHMPGDIVHGDTYGLPIYLVYTPVAALWPVTSDWDDVIGSLLVAVLAMLVAAAGIARATGPGGGSTRWPAIIALLAFPAALLSTSSGTNDGLIAAALVWALAWWARPVASSALLAVAGVAKFAPLVLLPLWLARLRGAALAKALAACAAVGAATLAGLVAFGGIHGPGDMAHAMTFQLSRRSMMSLWTTLGLQGVQPLAQALTLAVALGGAALVALDRDVARDPRRVAGLVTAVLAGLQLQANHWAPLYLLWLAPPAMVALLGPLGAPAPARVEDEETVPANTRFASV